MDFSYSNITDHVMQIHMPGSVSGFLVLGNKSAALIDTGLGAGSLKQYIQTLTDLPLTVIATHGHLDHIGGAEEFDKVYIPEEDKDLITVHGKREARRAYLLQNGYDCTLEKMTGDVTEKHIALFSKEQVFDLGGITVKMLPMAGHTAGMSCALIKEQRIVILGDGCNSATFMQIPGALPISAYRKSLENFMAYYGNDFDRVLFSHPHNFGDKEIVNEMIALCREMLQPGFEGISMENALGKGTYIAKAVDENLKRLDGYSANIVYTEIH